MVSSKEPVGPGPSVPVKFVSAGLAACVAEIITIPLDTAKVRLQIQGERSLLHVTPTAGSGEVPQFKYRGIFRTVYVISQEEGIRALYNGLVAGLQRQICFASIRIGLYDTVKQAYIDKFNSYGISGTGSNVALRIMAGITTGGAAVTFAQPTDVVKVRMQAQSGSVKRYTGCLNAYRTIATEEGVRGLWKGVLPNITRNAIVNAAELVSYDLIKEAILRRKWLTDNMPCHFVSAFGAGFCTTVVASPVDVVKTRFMNSAKGVYRGAFNCAIVMWHEGGFWAFYKGFMPSFVRLGSWNIAMWITFEQFKRLFTRIYDDHSND
jgi:solute carrier family 25 uncoupling protein 8/9